MGFRQNCRYYRKLRGMTQGDLANRLGIARVTVTQWESGYSEPRMGIVHRIAEVLGVSLSALLSDLPPGTSPADGLMSDAEIELLAIYRSLTDEGRRRLMEQAQFFQSSGEYRRAPGGSPAISA